MLSGSCSRHKSSDLPCLHVVRVLLQTHVIWLTLPPCCQGPAPDTRHLTYPASMLSGSCSRHTSSDLPCLHVVRVLLQTHVIWLTLPPCCQGPAPDRRHLTYPASMLSGSCSRHTSSDLPCLHVVRVLLQTHVIWLTLPPCCQGPAPDRRHLTYPASMLSGSCSRHTSSDLPCLHVVGVLLLVASIIVVSPGGWSSPPTEPASTWWPAGLWI